MKRIQKMAWTFVITISIAVISATVATTVLYVKFGMPKASAGLAFLAIAGIGGFADDFHGRGYRTLLFLFGRDSCSVRPRR